MRLRQFFAAFLILLASCAPGKAYAKGELHKIPGIRLSGAIDDDMLQAFKKRLANLDPESEGIVIEINSGGGDVDSGKDIIWLIENLPVPSICVVDGDAASMAAWISQSCDVRVITKRSMFMIHEPLTGGVMSGQPTEWKNRLDYIEALTRAMCEAFGQKMLIDPAAIRDRIQGGRVWEMNWREAWEWGAFDEVVDRAIDVKQSLRVLGQMPPNLAEGIPQHQRAVPAK
jgi:ATP-dependent protease ClpP protease subunit